MKYGDISDEKCWPKVGRYEGDLVEKTLNICLPKRC